MEFKPDYELVAARYEAWWDCQVLDRPLVSITWAKPENEQVPLPQSRHLTLRERWLDCEHQARMAHARLANQFFYADALPVCFPNLGPEIFSAYYGCELEFGEDTVWSVPIAEWDWDTARELRPNISGEYFQKTLELTRALVECARGKFIVGYTDLHGGGDALAAFCDPQRLCLDLLTHGEAIGRFNARLTQDFLEVHGLFHEMLSAAGMPGTSWLPAVCRGKFHIPSNDFSCMVSSDMFEAVFLPEIARECAAMDRNIYHLDGLGALRHLDHVLELPNLHAIQWVPGAGREHWRQWVEVYRRIQGCGKAFTIQVPMAELDELMDCLRPEGAWITVGGVGDRETADAALRALSRWRGHGRACG